MRVRFLIEPGDNINEVWARHVRAYVRAGMCPRCGNGLDGYGRCHPIHGRWEVTDVDDDGIAWTWDA